MTPILCIGRDEQGNHLYREREGGREGGREKGRDGGREGGREGEMEGERVVVVLSPTFLRPCNYCGGQEVADSTSDYRKTELLSSPGLPVINITAMGMYITYITARSISCKIKHGHPQ